MNARVLIFTKVTAITLALAATASAATITVTDIGDTISVDGKVTLREAITSANNNASINTDVSSQNPGAYGTDAINFNIPGAGVHTISPTAALPVITGPLSINGYTQGGSHENTLPNGDNAVLQIQLSGANAGAGTAKIGIPGLSFGAGSDGSAVSGLIINQFSGDGIRVKGAGNIGIQGNFIGTNPAGTAPGPGNANTTFDFIAPMRAGVFIDAGSNNNRIGGTSTDRNVIAGNVLDNIHISALGNLTTGNIVEGNFIGVGADGASIISNSGFWGIEVSGVNASSTIIGGATVASRNVIGGNNDGIELDDGTHDNFIGANFIGVAADGVTPAGNRTHGIALRDFDGSPGLIGNSIGSSTAGAGNTIANNGASGIAIFGDPNVTPQNNNNPILGNSIYHNSQNFRGAGLGIDLVTGNTYPEGDGPTPNDVGDSDAGPNNLQNYPVLSTFFPASGGTDLNYTLNSRNNHGAGQKYLLEFFLNDSPTFDGYGEGQVLATRVTITVGANPGPYADEGQSTFSDTLHFAFVATGHYFSATATELAGLASTAPLNTSEFSKAVAAFPTATPAAPKLGNISTRAVVQTGDNVLIAGFIAIGSGPMNVVIIALGPSLGIPGELADPTMELHDRNGVLVDSNDNWMDSPNKQYFIDLGLAPPNPLESAIARTVNAPESYTAIVRGVNNGTGIAVVQVFEANSGP